MKSRRILMIGMEQCIAVATSIQTFPTAKSLRRSKDRATRPVEAMASNCDHAPAILEALA
jgi:hypothetical protein